ncbi:MAG: hypothetical protein AMJ79_03365 [Phycisphaerae bacterium SM23_30]|nr:MAG: hypothetical protein AMJ79_03365 [Phycisphaerae bacterium SM23_30]
MTLLLGPVMSGAQGSDEKKPLSFEDYSRWRSISSTAISEDGNWITYAYAARDKDGTLYIKHLTSDKVIEVERGSAPRFSDDSRWVAYNINPPVRKPGERRGQQPGGQPQQPGQRGQRGPSEPRKVELLDLSTGDKYTVENVSSFSFSKGSNFFTVRKAKADPQAQGRGTDLLLRNLKTGMNELIGNVTQFAFNKPGTLLAYVIDVPDKAGNGLYLIDLAASVRKPLDTDKAVYEHLTWDEEGTALAVLKGDEKEGFTQKENALLAFTGLDQAQPEKIVYDPTTAFDFPKDTVISEKAGFSWSEDLSKVFFGIKEQEKEPQEKEDAEPVADVDIWHWQDDRIQSVQMIQANRDRNFTYQAVFNLDTKRFVRLTDEKMRRISLTRDGNWGIGQDDSAYISDWKPSLADYYRVDVNTGERTLMFKGHERTMGLSPDSKHFLYWKNSNVWDYKIESGESVNLTKSAPVNFSNDEYDHPGEIPPYGVTGWTKDGESVILTHKYDLYLQPLDGGEARNLTNGYGDKNEIRFRYVRLDPEERFIDLSKPILLSAFGQWTKKAGYYELNDSRLEQLIYEDKKFGQLTKAKNADKLMYTIETFADFPDYYISDTSFTYPKRVTDANPWQSEYIWGHRIQFDFENKSGVRLQGTLAIPDTYEEGQKLPMHVNFYEKNSQNLHSYTAPRHAGSPNFAGMVSNGYLVMQPDIHFNTGTSHSDMLECVEAAVQKVIDMGYADPKAVSLHGHSYSGQGSAYISTRSKMFAAIVYGAGATNLISDFNQLWKSAGTNQHRYDIYGQGRFGTNPYDDRELYEHESAVFNARSMDTPLLIMHGTEDGSVEWLQAIEFYNALRFNNKPVILLSYPGEGHGLGRLENQKDFQLRTRQFLDHYLKGKEAPNWMTKGVPFIKKKK